MIPSTLFSPGEFPLKEDFLLEIGLLIKKISLFFNTHLQKLLNHGSPPTQLPSPFHRTRHTDEVKRELFNKIDDEFKKSLNENSPLKDIVNAYRKQQKKGDVSEIISSIKTKNPSTEETTIYEIIAICEAYNTEVTKKEIDLLINKWEHLTPQKMFSIILQNQIIPPSPQGPTNEGASTE